MTDRDAFLRAICAAPDDDVPRLAFADWLDEHGDPDHAELIRLQCAGEQPDRVAELGRTLRRRAGIRKGPRLAWEGGLVARVTCELTEALTVVPKLAGLAAGYALRVVPGERDEEELGEPPSDDRDDAFRRLAAMPELAAVTALDLSACCPHHTGLEAILASPHLVNLRRIDAEDNEAGPAVERLASPTFRNLVWANFRNSDSFADNPSLAPIVGCGHLASLEHLNFNECEQGSDAVEALCATPHMGRLRFLGLSTAYFTTAGVRELAHARTLPALRELDLSHVVDAPAGTGQAEGVHPLIDSPLIEQLTRLWLTRNAVTDADAIALAESPRNLRFELLDLTENPAIADAGARALRARFGAAVRL